MDKKANLPIIIVTILMIIVISLILILSMQSKVALFIMTNENSWTIGNLISGTSKSTIIDPTSEQANKFITNDLIKAGMFILGIIIIVIIFFIYRYKVKKLQYKKK
jgi:hypothetical protein